MEYIAKFLVLNLTVYILTTTLSTVNSIIISIRLIHSSNRFNNKQRNGNNQISIEIHYYNTVKVHISIHPLVTS
jgi:hypothetical protein